MNNATAEIIMEIIIDMPIGKIKNGIRGMNEPIIAAYPTFIALLTG